MRPYELLHGVVEERDFARGARRFVEDLAERARGAAFLFQWDADIEDAYPIATVGIAQDRESEVRARVRKAWDARPAGTRESRDPVFVLGVSGQRLGAFGAVAAESTISDEEWEAYRSVAATLLYGYWSELKIGNFERTQRQIARERQRLAEILSSVESRHLRAERLAAEERARELQASNRRLEFALEKAEESSRLKGVFLAKISHEVRTPLNALMIVPTALLGEYRTVDGFHCPVCHMDFVSDDPEHDAAKSNCPTCGAAMTTTAVVENIGMPKEQRALLQDMADQGRVLSDLITSVLDFDQLENRRVRLVLGEVALHELVTELTAALQPLVRTAKLTLEASCPPGLRATVDRERMAQLLTNLIGNAIKFTAEGSIHVGVVDEGDTVHVLVRDTGPGIPESMHLAIFDSFRQVDDSHTRAEGGVGLGLAIAREIVEAHQGRIWVESVPGEGSTLHFRIPKAGPSQKPSSGARHA